MSTDPAANLKLRVFISSAQKELEEERMQLRILLTSDPFLLRYTVPKLFEKYPAGLRPDKKPYLNSIFSKNKAKADLPDMSLKQTNHNRPIIARFFAPNRPISACS
ncbi:hypothetical protein [Desulfonatronum sp. SC1]|uniref:hypothetical protein n=1 Tax=Desulfonatronum sp. SC1 TaxID=2109626 RepID=UPI000D2F8C03|nr:hypothetical protein [Desulfonatronum sp. SC1]PTN38518.1 hypothetical protein C6366_02940 [Desulfonatronum sp. SC1]